MWSCGLNKAGGHETFCYFSICFLSFEYCVFVFIMNIRGRLQVYFLFFTRDNFVGGSDKACMAVKSFETLTWLANSLALIGVVYSMSSQRVGEPFGYVEPHREVWRCMVGRTLLSLIAI
ncbi:unnamed protein product, partial [Cuscuta epithymum]